MNALRKRALHALVATAGILASGLALAAPVQVTFTGTVMTTMDPLVKAGDELSWTFSYEASVPGACDTFAGGVITRCTDVVTTATATVGGINLSGPGSGYGSVLSAEDGSSLRLRDLFQGSMGFGKIPGIDNPLLAFYLFDSAGTVFGPNPALPTVWNDQSPLNFDDLIFTLFNFEEGIGTPLAYGVIAGGRPPVPTPIPEPSMFWQLIFGLIAISPFGPSCRGIRTL
jgi:hypothetical protein